MQSARSRNKVAVRWGQKKCQHGQSIGMERVVGVSKVRVRQGLADHSLASEFYSKCDSPH